MTAILSCLCALLAGLGAYASELRAQLDALPETLDWSQAHTHMDAVVLLNVMDGLFEYDNDLKLKPRLASSWTLSPDGKTYVFKLKPGVKWSDGRPLHANDFVYSWNRLAFESTHHVYRNLASLIATEDGLRRLKVRALDPGTLEVTLRSPQGHFLHLMTFWVFFPMREDVVQKHGKDWWKPGKAVVLGAYQVSAIEAEKVQLKRNPSYHESHQGPNAVTLQIISSDSDALKLARAGKLDLLQALDRDEAALKAAGFRLQRVNLLKTCFLNLNTQFYPLGLPKVRRALATSIEPAAVARASLRGVRPASGLVPPELLPVDPRSRYQFDVNEGRKLMNEVGLATTNVPELEILVYSSDVNTLVAYSIRDQIQKNLGWKLSVRVMDYPDFSKLLSTSRVPMYLRCWTADYADADSFLAPFLSSDAPNRSAWSNPAYDKLVKEAAALPPGPQRQSRHQDALAVLRDGAPLIPLFHGTLHLAASSRVTRIGINGLGHASFRNTIIGQ